MADSNRCHGQGHVSENRELVQHGAIFIQHFLRTLFAHHQLRSVTFVHVARWRLS